MYGDSVGLLDQDKMFCGRHDDRLTHIMGRAAALYWVEQLDTPVQMVCGEIIPLNWAGITANRQDLCGVCVNVSKARIIGLEGKPRADQSKTATKQTP
jgi:hypothetical protein